MKFIGYYNDKVHGTIQLWEMKDESSKEWNTKPDDSDANQSETAERS